jgi:Domain of unknown function (DUF4157)
MSEYSATHAQLNTKPIFTPLTSRVLQRQCACGQHTVAGGECEACRKKREDTLQRAAISSPPVGEAPPIVHEVLRSPGQPLDAQTRAFMEPRFGHDFSGVRVYMDTKAAESAWAVNALAYTVGRDVVFGAGQYAPGTSEGRRLIAHELAHTIQQAPVTKPALRPITLFDETPAGRAAETEADHLYAGAIAAPQRQKSAIQTQTPVLQRQPFDAPSVRVRSPVFEETVTQLSDVAGANAGRPLNIDERGLAQGIFGRSIDYARVRLIPVDALQYRTVANNIYIPQNFTITHEDMAQTLIHELTHVWQYQHGGTSYISISLGTQIAATIRHGNRNYAYDYQINAGQSFFDFTPEQQGFIVENFFAMQRDRAAIPRERSTGATRTYESNHLDSTGFKAQLSATDRQAEIARELPLHEPLIQQIQAALPRPEASILLLRASDVMTSPGQSLAPVPQERQLVPVRPLLEIQF